MHRRLSCSSAPVRIMSLHCQAHDAAHSALQSTS
jgi:hypothetical protein